MIATATATGAAPGVEPQTDAVRAPINFAGSGDAQARLGRLHLELAPILGTSRIFVRHQGTTHFVSGSPDDTLLFPPSDYRAGQQRYEWHDRGDGVCLGRLIQ